MLMPSFLRPLGLSPKAEITLPRTGQRMPSVAGSACATWSVEVPVLAGAVVVGTGVLVATCVFAAPSTGTFSVISIFLGVVVATVGVCSAVSVSVGDLVFM